MLPRVSAALAQIIAPIQSVKRSFKSTPDRDPQTPHFTPSRPHLKVVPKPDEQTAQDPSKNLPAQKPREPHSRVAGAFAQLFGWMKHGHMHSLRALGLDTYRRLLGDRKKSSKFGKGVILDHKAE